MACRGEKHRKEKFDTKGPKAENLEMSKTPEDTKPQLTAEDRKQVLQSDEKEDKEEPL